MSKNIRDYLPKKEEEMLIQGKISKPLYDRVKVILERENLTWTATIEACLENFADELENSPPKANCKVNRGLICNHPGCIEKKK